MVNPYDEFAVEEALQLKEKLGGEVTVLAAGGDEAVKSLRQALAMGADKAVLCSDTGFDRAGRMGYRAHSRRRGPRRSPTTSSSAGSTP